MSLPLSHISVPSSASNTDKNILTPAINRIIDELNALGATVAAMAPAPSPTPAIVIDITAAQETAIMSVAVGGGFVLNGPTREIACQVRS